MKPYLTNVGKNLLLRGLMGQTIKFTKMQLGNGPSQDIASANALINPLVTVELSSITKDDSYITLTAAFSNGETESGFHVTEIGVFAEDPDDSNKEILYALGNAEVGIADYIPPNTDRIYEMEFAMVVFIGDAENVTAAINSSLVYVSKEEFENHEKATNPHNVTAKDVGLGEVPNVPTNEQTPTYTPGTEVEELESGEKLSTAFGKIAALVKNFLSHIKAKNPHELKAADVGAAASSHTHSASDINSGALGVQRGGTGAGTAETARKNLGAAAKATITTAVLSASSWSNGVYSFEGTYPSASYDIEVFLRGDTATTAQKTAFCKAEIAGCYNSNQIKAFGTVPTEDIPIILRVVKK